jgi:hypothetical protein
LAEPASFGKYELISRIAVGGMAEVFRAKAHGEASFEKTVAIKRIHPSFTASVEFVNMFIDEAKIAASLSHGNVVHIFDLGRVGDQYFIAMELVEGFDTRRILEEFKAKGRRGLPYDVAAYIVSEVCRGLDYAHRKTGVEGRNLGIIHRDISPSNVLVSFEGEVKIVDFGIAKAEHKLSRTRTGALKGKYCYLSPEAVRGQGIDQRSDIFSAGAVLYELVTGRRLFDGKSEIQILERIRDGSFRRPSHHAPDIPAALERIVLGAIEPDRARRFQTAGEFAGALQGYLHSLLRPVTGEDVAEMIRELMPRADSEAARAAEGKGAPATAPREERGGAGAAMSGGAGAGAGTPGAATPGASAVEPGRGKEGEIVPAPAARERAADASSTALDDAGAAAAAAAAAGSARRSMPASSLDDSDEDLSTEDDPEADLEDDEDSDDEGRAEQRTLVRPTPFDDSQTVSEKKGKFLDPSTDEVSSKEPRERRRTRTTADGSIREQERAFEGEDTTLEGWPTTEYQHGEEDDPDSAALISLVATQMSAPAARTSVELDLSAQPTYIGGYPDSGALAQRFAGSGGPVQETPAQEAYRRRGFAGLAGTIAASLLLALMVILNRGPARSAPVKVIVPETKASLVDEPTGGHAGSGSGGGESSSGSGSGTSGKGTSGSGGHSSGDADDTSAKHHDDEVAVVATAGADSDSTSDSTSAPHSSDDGPGAGASDSSKGIKKPKPKPKPIVRPKTASPAGFGFLTVGAVPYAAVAIDGVSVGKGSKLGEMKLTAGKHVVSFSNREKGLVKAVSIEISSGGRHSVTVSGDRWEIVERR